MTRPILYIDFATEAARVCCKKGQLDMHDKETAPPGWIFLAAILCFAVTVIGLAWWMDGGQP